jgi:molybdopterin converting factor small subunit
MAVTFKFIGSLRSMSGKSKFTLNLEHNVPLSEAIKKASDELPKLSRVLLDSDREIASSNVLILVNGKDISVLGGLKTLLKDGDEVILVPVLHGG